MPAAAQRRQPVVTSPDQDGLVLFASRHAPGFSMASVSHDWHKWLLVTSGCLRISLTDRDLLVGAGQCSLLPAGTEHQLDDRQPATLIGIGLTDAAIASLPPLTAAWHACRRHAALATVTPAANAWSQVRSLATTALTEAANAQRLGQWIAITRIIDVLHRHLDNHAGDSVAGVLDWLQANPTATVRLAELATRAKVSQRTLTTRLRERFGCSFSSYQRAQRVTAMCRLLSTGTAVLDAALAAGFNDLSHAYRQFRHQTGTTPAAWANKHGASAPG